VTLRLKPRFSFPFSSLETNKSMDLTLVPMVSMGVPMIPMDVPMMPTCVKLSWLQPLTVFMWGYTHIPFEYLSKERDIFVTNLVADF
jgi:hypothetical protein